MMLACSSSSSSSSFLHICAIDEDVVRDLCCQCRSHSHVAEETQLALVELALRDLLPASDERHQDRDKVGAAQTNDRDADKGIERRAGAEVQAGEDDLDGCAKEEGIERHFVSLGDSAEEFGAGETTVAGEPDEGRYLLIIRNTESEGVPRTHAQMQREAACEQARPHTRPLTSTEISERRSRA